MAPRGEAGGAHEPDLLTAAHARSRGPADAGRVGVRRGEPLAGAARGGVAVPAVGAGREHGAVLGGVDRLAARPADVHARVEPGGSVHRVSAVAESGHDGAAGRPEQFAAVLPRAARARALDQSLDPGRLRFELGDRLFVALPGAVEIFEGLGGELDLEVDLLEEGLLLRRHGSDPLGLAPDLAEPHGHPVLVHADAVLPGGHELAGHPHPGEQVRAHRQDPLDVERSVGDRPEVVGAQDRFGVCGRPKLVRGGGLGVQQLLLGQQVGPGALQSLRPQLELMARHVQRGLHLGELRLSRGQVLLEEPDLGGQSRPMLLGGRELLPDVPALLCRLLELLTPLVQPALDLLELLRGRGRPAHRRQRHRKRDDRSSHPGHGEVPVRGGPHPSHGPRPWQGFCQTSRNRRMASRLATAAMMIPAPSRIGTVNRISGVSIHVGTNWTSPRSGSMNRNFMAKIASTAATPPIKPSTTPSIRNGTRMNQFVAPTSFMMAISLRRANTAIRTVLPMSPAADRSMMAATAITPVRSTLVTARSRFKMACSSRIWSMAGSPASRARITGKSAGSTSFTRYDCGMADGSTFSTSAGLSRNSCWKFAYACSRFSKNTASTSGIDSMFRPRASISSDEAFPRSAVAVSRKK